MKNSFGIIGIILLAFLILPSNASAQYGKKKKKKRPPKESVEEDGPRTESNRDATALLEKVWFGLNVGSPNVNSQFLTLGVGPMAAYKFNRILSAGVITDFNYTYFWNSGNSAANYIDYSVGVFGRARFLRQFYGHVEYNYTSLDRVTTIEPRSNFPVLFLGAGYTSGRPPWGFEATLLVDVLGNLAQYRIPIVYRLGVTYAF